MLCIVYLLYYVNKYQEKMTYHKKQKNNKKTQQQR